MNLFESGPLFPIIGISDLIQLLCWAAFSTQDCLTSVSVELSKNFTHISLVRWSLKCSPISIS